MLKRAGVAGSNIINIYKCSVRSILEYAVPAWQDILESLSVKLKSTQKRALKIVFPYYSYDEALYMSSGLESLGEKTTCYKSKSQVHLCVEVTCHEVISVPYDLRSGHEKSFRPYTRTKRANDFITFKFLD